MGKYVTHVVEHVGNRRCKYVIADSYKLHWSSWAWIKGYFCTAFGDTINQFDCLWNPRKCFGTTWKEPLSINVEDTGIFHIHVYFFVHGNKQGQREESKNSSPMRISLEEKGYGNLPRCSCHKPSPAITWAIQVILQESTMECVFPKSDS